MRTTWLSSLIAASLLVGTVQIAQAESHKQPRWPTLELDAQAYTEVTQDTVTITLQATRQSSEQAVVTKQLTEVVSQVLNEAKQQEVVKVSSRNYYVRPQHDKDGKIVSWIGQSQLLFESTDIPAASQLAAKYQDQLPIANVSFSVSKQARSQAEAELMTDAAQAFQQRAQSMAVALGYSGYRLKDIRLGGSGAVYRAPRMQFNMVAASADVPESLPIDSGTEEISLSLSGSVYLLEQK